MKSLLLAFALLLTIPAADDGIVLTSAAENTQCISADKIVRSILEWRILATTFVKKNKVLFLEITAHNPLNKQSKDAVDATFTFNVNTSSGISSSNYDLVKAVFNNKQSRVIFEKTFKTEKVKNGRRIIEIQIPTMCFQRKVVSITENKTLIKLRGYLQK